MCVYVGSTTVCVDTTNDHIVVKKAISYIESTRNKENTLAYSYNGPFTSAMEASFSYEAMYELT